MTRRVVFKAEAKRVTPGQTDDKDNVIEVRLWQGNGGGSYSSLGQPMRMSEAAYIAFMHKFDAIHQWMEEVQ